MRKDTIAIGEDGVLTEHVVPGEVVYWWHPDEITVNSLDGNMFGKMHSGCLLGEGYDVDHIKVAEGISDPLEVKSYTPAHVVRNKVSITREGASLLSSPRIANNHVAKICMPVWVWRDKGSNPRLDRKVLMSCGRYFFTKHEWGERCYLENPQDLYASEKEALANKPEKKMALPY